MAAPAKAEPSDKSGVVLQVPTMALGEIIADNSEHSTVIVLKSLVEGDEKATGEKSTVDPNKPEALVSTVRIIPNQWTLNRPGPVFCYLPRMWLAGIMQMNSFKTEIKLMPEDEDDAGAIRPSYATVAIEQWGR